MVQVVRLETEFPQLGNIVYTRAPFGQAVEDISELGGRLASLADIAKERILLQGKDGMHKWKTIVREAFLYVPGKKPLFVSESPLLDPKKAWDATRAHRRVKQFLIDEAEAIQYFEQAEEDKNKDPAEVRVLSLDSEGLIHIPTRRFGEEKLTRAFFKEQAQPYGDLLASYGIRELDIWSLDNWNINRETMPFCRQISIGRISSVGKSEINVPYLSKYALTTGLHAA